MRGNLLCSIYTLTVGFLSLGGNALDKVGKNRLSGRGGQVLGFYLLFLGLRFSLNLLLLLIEILYARTFILTFVL